MTVVPALQRIQSLLEPKGWTDEDAAAAWLTDSRGIYHGRCLGLARPESTAQLAEIIALCAAARIPVVPQGGNTGRCGGATPDASGAALLINMARMNRIRAIDVANAAITVEAGCILRDIQESARRNGLFFPLSLGAEGSCQIGGNLASNAGGINVLRYGTARELTLGLEAVLPDGRVWNGLRALRKDNAGYDLKQLLIGSEGTLAIITAAVLRLFPVPQDRATAFCALSSVEDCPALLHLLRAQCGDLTTSFELLPRIALTAAIQHTPGLRAPLSPIPDWAALVELSARDGAAMLQSALEKALADGIITDAALAVSQAQRSDFWRLREAVVEAQSHFGACRKHDVSVPVAGIADFLRRADAAVEALCPGVRPYAFGHAGDGNIHYNLLQPQGMTPASFAAIAPDLTRAVHDIVAAMHGSVSAEHGIGREKKGELARYRSPLELELMMRIKNALDPAGIMNPGVLLPGETAS